MNSIDQTIQVIQAFSRAERLLHALATNNVIDLILANVRVVE
jgi:hypothetical protein